MQDGPFCLSSCSCHLSSEHAGMSRINIGNNTKVVYFCKEKGKEVLYIGETGRSGYDRGLGHITIF